MRLVLSYGSVLSTASLIPLLLEAAAYIRFRWAARCKRSFKFVGNRHDALVARCSGQRVHETAFRQSVDYGQPTLGQNRLVEDDSP
jgi:hypothetical protein